MKQLLFLVKISEKVSSKTFVDVVGIIALNIFVRSHRGKNWKMWLKDQWKKILAFGITFKVTLEQITGSKIFEELLERTL